MCKTAATGLVRTACQGVGVWNHREPQSGLKQVDDARGHHRQVGLEPLRTLKRIEKLD